MRYNEHMEHPTGILSLVFTDIQDSTKLWDQIGSEFLAILQAHNHIIRRCIEQHNGFEVKTDGDAFMVAFQDSADAIYFAIEIQEQLHQHKWPDNSGGILVRTGIHTGTPLVEHDEHKNQVDYFGPMVNLAARVSDAAHGGQILITGNTYKASVDQIKNVTVKSLGEHRFKGVEEAELLYEVVPSALGERVFPPPRTIDVNKTNLSKNPSTFHGREKELNRLNDLFHKENKRLVTVTGPGGIGKTRLTQAWASTSVHVFSGGVWFVDITEAQSRDDICRGLAMVLNIPLNSDEPAEQIGNALHGITTSSDGEVLILLDNCEQIIQVSANLVKQWLTMAPKVKFLVTSRFLVKISGGQELALDQLKIPGSEDIEKSNELE